MPHRDQQSRCRNRKRRSSDHFECERKRAAWHEPYAKRPLRADETPQDLAQLTPYPGIDQHRVFTELGQERTRRLGGYSFSLNRIRPAPVTMGPLAVTMT